MHSLLISPEVGALSALTRQTNIIWVGFVMAVSVIRDLKEADIAGLEREEESPTPRARLLFDPLAADAQFPGILSRKLEFH